MVSLVGAAAASGSGQGSGSGHGYSLGIFVAGLPTFITWKGARAGLEGAAADLDGEEHAMAAAWHPFGFLGGSDPFRELRRLQGEMDRLAGAMGPATVPGGFPAVNVYAGQDGIRCVERRPVTG